MVYQGSKTKYAKDIVPILQKLIDDNNITVFVDGMCGGCNIVDKIKCEIRIAMDLNSDLISLYKQAVYNKNFCFPDKITREDWDKCKNSKQNNSNWENALVAYFASYSARGFNGGYALNGDRDYYTERLNNFKKQLPNLNGIAFVAADIFALECNDVLIYLDPPYKNTKKYDLSKDFDTDAFWEKVRQLSKDNIVIVSEQEAPDDFECIWSKDTNRNCFGAKPTKATECLFRLKER